MRASAIRGACVCLALAGLVGGCGGAADRKAHYAERAAELAAAGQLDKARIEYRNALQIDPRDAELHVAVARVLEELQNWRRAAGHYQKAVSLDPEHQAARIGLARLYLLSGVLDKAAELVESVLLTAPNNPPARVARASLRALGGDRAGARADLALALREAPAQANAIALSASLDAEDGRLPAAAETLRAGLEANPQHPGLASLYGRVLLAQGHAREALKVLRRVVEGQPEALRYRVHLGAVLADLGEVDSGEQLLREGVTARPEDREAKLTLVRYVLKHRGMDRATVLMRGFIDGGEPMLKVEMARLLESSGHIDAGRQVYRQVVASVDKEHPATLGARAGLARLLADAGRWDEAMAEVDLVLAENPRDREALTIRGTVALVRNDPASAIVDFRTVLRDHADAHGVLRLKARAHALNNEPEQAVRDLRQLARLDRLDVAARIELAELLASAGATAAASQEREAVLAEAELLTAQAVETQPGDRQSLLMAARVAMLQGRHQIALEQLSDAVQRFPEDAAVRRLLAGALARTTDLPGALQAAERAVQLDPGNEAARTQLAEILVLMGATQAAEQRLSEAVDTSPDSLTLLQALARLQSNTGQWQRAKATAERLKKRFPNQSAGWYYAGVARRAQGDAQGSRTAFRAAVERSPHAVGPALALARSHLDAGAHQEAEDVVARVLDRVPDDVAALNFMGEVLIESDRARDAERYLKRALALKPEWLVPHRNLAHARAAVGEVEQAAQALREGVKSNASGIQAAYELATFYERIGRTDLAIAQYEALLRQDPGSEVGANNLAMLLATYERDPASLQRALVLARRLEGSRRHEFLDTLGWVQHRVGLHADAVVTLERAARLAPNDAGLHYHLGLAYLGTGRNDDARRALRSAVATSTAFNGVEDARAALDRLNGLNGS